ncbi:MAG: nucleotide exchange factor GrpE [Ruminococcus sp.]|nr:nucleotide exchange factor GrpE [Ruminococcus sp.]
MAENEKTVEEMTEEAVTEETKETAEEVSEEAATAEGPKEETAEEKVSRLEKELADEKERYLRLDAEYYNYRNRSVKEKSEAYENATIAAVKDILSVIDDFERALAAECSDNNFKKGIEMIYSRYKSILEKLGVAEIESEGQPFDPNVHNAVSSTEDESLGENVVAAVLRKGYVIGKKVIRPAMVTVANP